MQLSFSDPVDFGHTGIWLGCGGHLVETNDHSMIEWKIHTRSTSMARFERPGRCMEDGGVDGCFGRLEGTW